MSGNRKPSERAATATKKRYREVRDIYNKLRRTYNHTVVIEFFERNYFIQEGTVSQIVGMVDDQPVDPSTASICYTTVMDSAFKL